MRNVKAEDIEAARAASLSSADAARKLKVTPDAGRTT